MDDYNYTSTCSDNDLCLVNAHAHRQTAIDRLYYICILAQIASSTELKQLDR